MQDILGRRALLALGAAGLVVWGGAAYALDAAGASSGRSGPSDAPVDAVVVLGCRVVPPGVAGPCLKARTVAGVTSWEALAEAGQDPLLLTTGGVGEVPPAEADVAATLALAMGVPGAQIRTEAASRSTWENAACALPLLGAEGAAVVLVTDRYHLFRARRVFERHGLAVHGVGVTSPGWTRISGALREVLAVTLYGVQGRLSATGPRALCPNTTEETAP